MTYRKINTRSPFYVERATTAAEVTLYMRIWLGSLLTKPSAATYIIKKDATGGRVVFEIAELVRDYIEQTGDYTDGAVWVETYLQDTAIPDVSVIYLATEGYNTSREDMSHSGNSFVNDYVMLPKDTDGSYRVTGAKGEISKFQVMINAENNTDWTYTTYDTQGTAAALSSSNLITYSENFNQWDTNQHSIVIEGETDINGGLDAWRFEALNSGTFLSKGVNSLDRGTTYTQSIHVKYNGADAELEFNNSVHSTGNIFLVDSNGVTALTPSANRSVESLANGWYRISIKFTTSSSPLIEMLNSDVILNIEEELEGVYLFGAQLEAQESATDYIKTEGFIIEGTQAPAGSVAISSSSDSLIRTFKLDDSIGRIEFSFDGIIKTVYHDVFDCNKYNNEQALTIGLSATYAKTSRPVILSYVNKHGAKNTFAFTLKHKQEMQSKSNTFIRNVVDHTNLNRNKNLHSERKIMGTTKQSFTINTDFINEYYVEQIEELLLSEYVWALNPLIDDVYVPVIVTDKKILKKNHLNDKLIQYEVTYEMSGNYINITR